MHERKATDTRLSLTLALGLALLCLVLPTSAHAAKQQPLYWGAWIGGQLTGEEAPWDMSAVSRFEAKLGKGLSLVEFSSPFADCGASRCPRYAFPTAQMQKIREYGAIPFFSWGSASSAAVRDPNFQLSDVVAGRHDRYIREFAEDARAWNHPFFLRFNWEMNGDWFPWGAGVNGNDPGEFVAAWRHVHKIFAAVGAGNATWVWCPYARSESLRPFYPGGRYVDWTCMDGFNWGPNSPKPAPWRSFRTIFDTTYRQIVKRLAPGKPMVLAEIATNGRGQVRSAWIREMFATLRTRYRQVRALIWFDKVDREVRWPIESSAPALRAFRKGLRGPYKPNVYADLAASPIGPPGR